MRATIAGLLFVVLAIGSSALAQGTTSLEVVNESPQKLKVIKVAPDGGETLVYELSPNTRITISDATIGLNYVLKNPSNEVIAEYTGGPLIIG